MGTDRFSPRPIWTGHWKALRNRSYAPTGRSARDAVAVAVVYAIPFAIATAAVAGAWTIKNPSALLAGVSLLVGGCLVAFGQLAAWRGRLAERVTWHETSERPERHAIDEAVAHLLWATWIAVVEAALLVVAGEMMPDPERTYGWAARLLTAGVYGLGTYLVLLLLMILPKLYVTYANANKLDDEMSGTVQ